MSIAKLNSAGELEGHRCTFRIEFPDDITYAEAADIVLQQVGSSVVTALQPFGNGRFQATCKSHADYTRMINTGIKYKEAIIPVSPAHAASRTIIIRNTPVEMAKSLLLEYLQPYGVVTYYREDRDKRTQLLNGTRTVRMNMNKNVPNVLPIGIYKLWCHYEGVQVLCRRCLKSGHMAAQCEEKRCKSCHEFTHKASCTTLYTLEHSDVNDSDLSLPFQECNAEEDTVMVSLPTQETTKTSDSQENHSDTTFKLTKTSPQQAESLQRAMFTTFDFPPVTDVEKSKLDESSGLDHSFAEITKTPVPKRLHSITKKGNVIKKGSKEPQLQRTLESSLKKSPRKTRSSFLDRVMAKPLDTSASDSPSTSILTVLPRDGRRARSPASIPGTSMDTSVAEPTSLPLKDATTLLD